MCSPNSRSGYSHSDRQLARYRRYLHRNMDVSGLRECSVCYHVYEGLFGECPACEDAHEKATKRMAVGRGGLQARKPTLGEYDRNCH